MGLLSPSTNPTEPLWVSEPEAPVVRLVQLSVTCVPYLPQMLPPVEKRKSGAPDDLYLLPIT
jgi:hypothetical protein